MCHFAFLSASGTPRIVKMISATQTYALFMYSLVVLTSVCAVVGLGAMSSSFGVFPVVSNCRRVKGIDDIELSMCLVVISFYFSMACIYARRHFFQDPKAKVTPSGGSAFFNPVFDKRND